MLARAEHAGGNAERIGIVAQRLDRRAGGDLAVERQLDDFAAAIARGRRGRQRRS